MVLYLLEGGHGGRSRYDCIGYDGQAVKRALEQAPVGVSTPQPVGQAEEGYSRGGAKGYDGLQGSREQ
jgi:hypothetical protein